VASLGLQKGSLEDHVAMLQSLDSEVTEYRPQLDELERVNQEVQEALVFDNPHTPYTMEVSSPPTHLPAHTHMPYTIEVDHPYTHMPYTMEVSSPPTHTCPTPWR